MFFWLPDGSPVHVRIDPVQNLPTVVVIPIPARTAKLANFFVTLTIASRNLATPILDATEKPKLGLSPGVYDSKPWNPHCGVTDQPVTRNLQSLRPGNHTIDEEGR